MKPLHRLWLMPFESWLCMLAVASAGVLLLIELCALLFWV